MYKALEVEIISREKCLLNNGMPIKRDNVRIKSVDLHDVIVESKKNVHSVVSSIISTFSYL